MRYFTRLFPPLFTSICAHLTHLAIYLSIFPSIHPSANRHHPSVQSQNQKWRKRRLQLSRSWNSTRAPSPSSHNRSRTIRRFSLIAEITENYLRASRPCTLEGETDRERGERFQIHPFHPLFLFFISDRHCNMVLENVKEVRWLKMGDNRLVEWPSVCCLTLMMKMRASEVLSLIHHPLSLLDVDWDTQNWEGQEEGEANQQGSIHQQNVFARRFCHSHLKEHCLKPHPPHHHCRSLKFCLY